MTPLVFEALFNNIPQHVFWKDKNLTFKGCNKHFLTQFGFDSPEQLIGKTDYDLPITQELAEKYRNDDLNVLLTQTPKINFEEISMNVAHEERIVQVSKYPYFDANHQICGVLGIFTDITDLKNAEKREKIAISRAEKATIIAETEKEMRKTVMVLVGDIVHDLRTPIATIRMVGHFLEIVLPILLEIIEEAKQLGAQKLSLISKKKWDYLTKMTLVASLENSVTMMDNFINTTLIELSTAQKTSLSDLNYNDLTMCSSRRVIENTLEAYPIPSKIVINQNIGYDFCFRGNSILMMKLLFNLIKNSIEQIESNNKGEITIITEDDGKRNLIRVKDTAGGATYDVVSHFFTGYFTTKKNGTGIGLAYCKNAMHIFGGDISCQSIEGESMEFILSFPKVN